MTGNSARKQNLRSMTPSMGMGKDVRNTKQIKGEASKDSLTGKNTVKEYRTSGPPKGHMGGRNTSS